MRPQTAHGRQLLLEVHMCATEPSLAIVSKHLRRVFADTSDQYRAAWLCERLPIAGYSITKRLTHALRFPICTAPVFDLIAQRTPFDRYRHDPPLAELSRPPFPTSQRRGVGLRLPSRLFRGLAGGRIISADDRALVHAVTGSPWIRVHPRTDPQDWYDFAYSVMTAAAIGDEDLICALLPHLDRVDPRAVHMAVRQGHVRIVKRLLYHYADSGGLDDLSTGKPLLPPDEKMLELAVERGHVEVADLLISLGMSLDLLSSVRQLTSPEAPRPGWRASSASVDDDDRRPAAVCTLSAPLLCAALIFSRCVSRWPLLRTELEVISHIEIADQCATARSSDARSLFPRSRIRTL